MTSDRFLRSKWFIAFVHASVWAVVLMLPLFFGQNNPPPEEMRPKRFSNREDFQLLSTLMNISFIPFFYLNAFFFVPKFLNKRKWHVYTLLIVLIIALIYLINSSLRGFFMPMSPFPPPSGIIVFLSVFIVFTSTAFYYIQHNIQREKIRKEKEAENLKTELLFLRSQVSPHFLFNTLNNLVSLARKKSDLLEPSLLKLSGLLQYMLYESDSETISIHKEIEYLDNYIELQKLRFGNDVKISFSKEVPFNSTIEVVPMILIPFVENAFKHGVVYINDAEISIDLILIGNFLVFNVKNKFNPIREEKDKSSGIGLANLKRRLNLLYPESKLEITEEDNWHIINLSIII